MPLAQRIAEFRQLSQTLDEAAKQPASWWNEERLAEYDRGQLRHSQLSREIGVERGREAALNASATETQDPHMEVLIEKAKGESPIASIVSATVEGVRVDGAVAELQQERGAENHAVPLDLFPQMANPNTIYQAVTPAPSDTGAAQPRPLLPVFAMGDPGYLGVTTRRVPSGDMIVPTLSTRPTVTQKGAANSDTISETTGKFDTIKMEPGRLQASWHFRRTERAQLMGMEQALSAALTMGIMEAISNYVVTKTITDLGAATDTAAIATYAAYRALVGSRVDGRYARRKRDIRVLVGSATYGHADSLFQSNGDLSAADALTAQTGGFEVSAHMPAVASKKQNVLIRLGMGDDATLALWESGVSLIRDEVTRAQQGEIVITGIQLANYAVSRKAAFALVDQQIQA